MKKTSRKKLEADLNKKGLLSPAQAKKVRTAQTFFAKNPNTTDPQHLSKDLHELSFSEFKSIFSKDALRLTKYKSASDAESLLKNTYIDTVVEAIQANKDNVNIDGLGMVAFRTEYFKMAQRYCKARKINL